MKKLNIAIIGQGRSGKNIHGAYYISERNEYYNVKYVVDADEFRREVSKKRYEGCIALADYRELFNYKDIDLVVNASFSQDHFNIAKDVLEHGYNVLTEKPFAKTQYECETLIQTAKKNGVLLAVFHNTQPAPYYVHACETIASGRLGDVKQISIRFNGFSRRWDWQTLQKKIAGGVYNTGPHPIGMALGFLGFDKNTKVVYSKLDTALTSGDSDDYAKIILTAPGKPVIDIEISAIDAYSDYFLKIQGSKGTMKSTADAYKCKYIVDGENVERPVIEEFLKDENGNPIYCSENLITHEEEGTFDGTAFDVGTAEIYKQVYYAITENKPLNVTPDDATMVISVIEQVHAQNPLPVKFI